MKNEYVKTVVDTNTKMDSSTVGMVATGFSFITIIIIVVFIYNRVTKQINLRKELRDRGIEPTIRKK